AEDLLPGDPMRLRDVGEERRPEPVAALWELAGRLVDLGSLLHPGRDEALDLLQLLQGVDGPDVGVLVERVSHPEGPQATAQLLQQRLEDRLLDEQAAPRAADVALVEVDAVDDALH